MMSLFCYSQSTIKTELIGKFFLPFKIVLGLVELVTINK